MNQGARARVLYTLPRWVLTPASPWATLLAAGGRERQAAPVEGR